VVQLVGVILEVCVSVVQAYAQLGRERQKGNDGIMR
jgi:hypothetical protein